jgi:hypothetical protein
MTLRFSPIAFEKNVNDLLVKLLAAPVSSQIYTYIKMTKKKKRKETIEKGVYNTHTQR